MCVGAQGTLFQVTIATVLTTVARCEKLSPPQSEVSVFRCKGLDAEFSSVFAEGSIDGGTADADLWWDPMDVVHIVLINAAHTPNFLSGAGAITAQARKKTWRARFTQLVTGALVSEPRNWVFVGVQKNFNVSISTGEPMKASLSIEVETSTTLPIVAGAA